MILEAIQLILRRRQVYNQFQEYKRKNQAQHN